ncbi:MAG TPA: DegQ family serine endoprotease [Bryobacteraceae bacterium]|nr:DegQ family serine endoprotease [Bryobacteraceae bacterium]
MQENVMKIRRWAATVVVLAALATGGILSQGIKGWTGHSVLGASKAAPTIATEGTPITLGNFANGFSSVLKPALPAVVNIRSSKVVKTQIHGGLPFNDPFFRQFFGDQFGQRGPQAQREQSLGSGVIITTDGTVLTNNHVIEGATDIKVFLNDKREFKATLVGTDPKTDVAVLKIDANNLPTLPLGNSSSLQVGDLIFAIGDPFGIGETATMGIVSAKGRGGLRIEDYEDFIQTDAAINPGNSGGAMIDLHGNLVGINTAILTGGSGGNQGVGFAIPINLARNVMDQIRSHGKVVRGYMGVYIQDVTPEIAKQFHLSETRGALIGDVSADTPGARAGLKRGDVILAVNGQEISGANELRLQISQTPPGTLVKLKVWRDGKTQDTNLTLGELPEKAEKASMGEEGGGALEGVDVENVNPEIAQQLNLKAGTHGVVVTSVDPSSAAGSVGLRQGDVIQEVNHKPITNVEEFRQAIAGAEKQSVLLLVNRGGVTSYLVVEAH